MIVIWRLFVSFLNLLVCSLCYEERLSLNSILKKRKDSYPFIISCFITEFYFLTVVSTCDSAGFNFAGNNIADLNIPEKGEEYFQLSVSILLCKLDIADGAPLVNTFVVNTLNIFLFILKVLMYFQLIFLLIWSKKCSM